MTRIALIHAVAVAMQPIAEALDRLWPEAERMSLLDDSLSRDRASDGRVTPAMVDRFVSLARYAEDTGADGILFTCSAFGPAIDAAANAVSVPVLRPNAAMFAAAATATRPGLLASFEPSLQPLIEEFSEISPTRLQTAVAPEAMRALAEGDGLRHDTLLAEAVEALADCDVIMLAQFSTARARQGVEQAVGCKVLTSPDSAALALQQACATT